MARGTKIRRSKTFLTTVINLHQYSTSTSQSLIPIGVRLSDCTVFQIWKPWSCATSSSLSSRRWYPGKLQAHEAEENSHSHDDIPTYGPTCTINPPKSSLSEDPCVDRHSRSLAAHNLSSWRSQSPPPSTSFSRGPHFALARSLRILQWFQRLKC